MQTDRQTECNEQCQRQQRAPRTDRTKTEIVSDIGSLSQPPKVLEAPEAKDCLATRPEFFIAPF